MKISFDRVEYCLFIDLQFTVVGSRLFFYKPTMQFNSTSPTHNPGHERLRNDWLAALTRIIHQSDKYSWKPYICTPVKDYHRTVNRKL